MSSGRPFRAFQSSSSRRPLLAVDLGYSSRSKSCGLAWDDAPESLELSFGDACRKTAETLIELERPVLVLEAPLSTFHNTSGNPEIRAEFERGRGWYWGPGVLTLVAAQRFLKVVSKSLRDAPTVDLAEAFLTNKPVPTRHSSDALDIITKFWATEPQQLPDGLEPVSDLISGIPSVRVFEP